MQISTRADRITVAAVAAVLKILTEDLLVPGFPIDNLAQWFSATPRCGLSFSSHLQRWKERFSRRLSDF